MIVFKECFWQGRPTPFDLITANFANFASSIFEMKTTHKIFFKPSQDMSVLADNSISEIITSPPYPMILMWDEIMSLQNENIAQALKDGKAGLAFEEMHKELDKVWRECYRVLIPGGFLCINIGDATRTVNGEFSLYNNHSRIVSSCIALGFNNLPNIIWRKQTNAPNKFMGSGMLPCGAYVTLEHEYILIFRKGGKREYKKDIDKSSRKASAFFWEERNIWFSDVWDLKGVKQKITNSESRERSAAFPFEIPYRLINMYSQYGDTVLDPFYGMGTTAQAAIALGRNSIGFEIDPKLQRTIESNLNCLSISDYNSLIKSRYDKHISFVNERVVAKGPFKHFNKPLSVDVMTSQEEDIEFHYLTAIRRGNQDNVLFEVEYENVSNINLIPKSEGSLF